MNSNKHFSSKSFGSITDKTVFFFSALMTKYWLYYPTIKMYNKAGYHVVIYDASPSIIFDGDVFKFLETSEALLADVREYIPSLKEQGVKHFYTHGSSMGTLFAMKSAIENPEIKKVIVNTTYGRMSDNLWNWNALAHIKKRLVRAGITQEQFDKILEPISPIPMAKHLKNKKLLLYLAKKDKVMRYEHTTQFREALDKEGVEYQYVENQRFGHLVNWNLNNLRSKIFLNFLKD